MSARHCRLCPQKTCSSWVGAWWHVRVHLRRDGGSLLRPKCGKEACGRQVGQHGIPLHSDVALQRRDLVRQLRGALHVGRKQAYSQGIASSTDAKTACKFCVVPLRRAAHD